MINIRLVWYLKSNSLISPFQSGFRSERSNNGNLVRLETIIRDAFVAVFSTWKKLIIPPGDMALCEIYMSSEYEADKLHLMKISCESLDLLNAFFFHL